MKPGYVCEVEIESVGVLRNPIEAEAYQGRYDFDRAEVRRSAIGGVLAEASGAATWETGEG